jgi:hypothetical protein
MRMLHWVLIAFPLAVPALIAAPALAETLGDARVGFSAERVLVINGQTYVGRMWHMPGEQRHEQDLPALRPIFILRADSAIGDIILPKLHTVVEFALPKELSLLGDPGLLRQPVGQETVNGIATTKYDVDGRDRQRQGFDDSLGTAPREDRHTGPRVVRDTARLRKAAAGSGRPIARYAAGATPHPVGGV